MIKLQIWVFRSYRVDTRSRRRKIRVISNHAVYPEYTTVISHALQENLLRAVVYRLPVNITVTHTLLRFTHTE